MTEMAAPGDAFLAARDLLLRHRADYEAACREFRWPVLDRFNWALNYFDPMADGNGQPALRIVQEGGAEERLSFDDLRRRSNRVANFLRGLGVTRGDRILLMLGNIRPLWECMLAAMKLGAVVIPTTTLLSAADIADRCARGQVRHVIAGAESLDKLVHLPPQITRIATASAHGWYDLAQADAEPDAFVPAGATRAGDPLLLYFTSGTTAKPKLVLHTHQSYPVGHLSTMYWIGLRPGDMHLNISAPGWAKHAWSSFFAPWNAGACIIVFNQARFAARRMLDVLVHCGTTTFCAPPTVWRLLVQEDLTAWKVGLREVVGAGEPLNPEVITRVRAAWGLTIRDGYGQTETTLQIGNTPGQAVKPGAMGRSLPGYAVVLDDESGSPATEGQICLSLDPPPLGLMQGYVQDDGSLVSAGGSVYRTGDVATQDADGYFSYVGRADDVFKAADYRISPFELESALIEHPAVVEAAVVPSPDPVRLAVPKAFIVPAEGHAPDRDTALAIFRHVRARLSPYLRVRRIEFAELPKTISGKIRRVQLRQQEVERRQAGTRGDAEFWEEDFAELASRE